MNLPPKLIDKLDKRNKQGTLRRLEIFSETKTDFFSNDYLGYAKKGKSVTLIGSSGSRLISGTKKQHLETEKYLAGFHLGESSLLFNSGYDANTGFFSCIAQKGDIILYDELIHASVREGIRLSHAKAYRFKHNDMCDLEKKIQQFNTAETLYVSVESVYSMDGDSPDFQAIKKMVRRYDIRLIIDEAHSLGIYGKQGEGLAIEHNIHDDCFARLYTFGKALGCQGAVWVGSNELMLFLINFASSFIYTTALPEAMASNIQERYRILSEDNFSRERLRRNIMFYQKTVRENKLTDSFSLNHSPIQTCGGKTTDKLKKIAERLHEEGFAVKPVFSPTVPIGKERLRISLHSFNTFSQIQQLISLINESS